MKYHEKLSLLLLFVFGLTPLLWFRGEAVINGTDVDFPIYAYERLLHRLQVWDYHFLGGTDRSNNVASLPFVLVSALYEMIGFDNQAVQKLTYCTWMISVGLSMRFFLQQVVNRTNALEYHFSITLGSIVYMIGFYNVFLWVRLQLSVTTLILIPLLLGVLTASYKRVDVTKLYLLLAFGMFMCGPTGLQPPLLSIIVLLVLSHFFYFGLQKNPASALSRYIVLRRYLTILIICILSSLYWILPLANFISASNYLDSTVGMEVFSVKSLMGWSSSVSSFLNTFRLYGDVPWFDSWGGQRYLEYFRNYQENFTLVLLSAVMPIVAFMGILTSRDGEEKKLIIFYLAAYLVALFLGKGLHRPFGELYEWLIENVPLFWIHRAPWQKFGLLSFFCLCVLFTFGTLYIMSKLSNSNHKYRKYILFLVPTGLLAYVVYYNHLFLIGEHFNRANNGDGYHEKFQLGFHNNYPSYLFEAREFINSHDGDFKIFLLPDFKTNVYDWGYAGSSDVSVLLFKKGLIFRQYGEGMVPPNSADWLQNRVAEAIYNNPNSTVSRILGLLNVKYILQRNDFRYYFFNGIDSPDFIAKQLDAIPNITKKVSIGKWDFYSVDDDLLAGKHYIPSKVIYYDETKPDLNELLSPYQSGVAYVPGVREGVRTFPHSHGRFKKISTTNYIVEIDDPRGVIPIVLNESFHRDWKIDLIVGDHEIDLPPDDSIYQQYKNWLVYFIKRLRSENISSFVSHEKSNFFSNIWFLDVDKLIKTSGVYGGGYKGGKIILNIHFRPQNYLFIGLTISVVTLVLMLVLVLLKQNVRRKQT